MNIVLYAKTNAAFTVEVAIKKRAVEDFAVGADWTPVAGDVKVSKDGAAAANIGTLPVALVMGNGAVWTFTLTASEMSANRIIVTVVDAATKAVEDLCLVILTNLADAILDFTAGVETNFTLRQALRLMFSALVGKVSGAGTTSIAFRDVNDTKNRLVATVDTVGNRSAVTKDAT